MPKEKLKYSINSNHIEQTKAVEYFKNSVNNNLDIIASLDFFTRRYVVPISKLVDISKCIVVDSGCAHGWFSIAYLINGGKLEHVGKRKVRALNKIRDAVSKLILITTPNKLFPSVAHDTRLPFIHWLPPCNKKPISKLFKRQMKDVGTEFITPFDLNLLLKNLDLCQNILRFLVLTSTQMLSDLHPIS